MPSIVCPNCYEPHPPVKGVCLVAGILSVLISLGKLTEDQVAERLAKLDVASVWMDLVPIINGVGDGAYDT
jgi:hypothetical protein